MGGAGRVGLGVWCGVVWWDGMGWSRDLGVLGGAECGKWSSAMAKVGEQLCQVLGSRAGGWVLGRVEYTNGSWRVGTSGQRGGRQERTWPRPVVCQWRAKAS